MLTTKQVADRLGVTRRWIVTEIKAGHLRAVKFGGAWAITEKDLATYQPKPVGWPKGKSRKQP